MAEIVDITTVPHFKPPVSVSAADQGQNTKNIFQFRRQLPKQVVAREAPAKPAPGKALVPISRYIVVGNNVLKGQDITRLVADGFTYLRDPSKYEASYFIGKDSDGHWAFALEAGGQAFDLSSAIAKSFGALAIPRLARADLRALALEHVFSEVAQRLGYKRTTTEGTKDDLLAGAKVYLANCKRLTLEKCVEIEAIRNADPALTYRVEHLAR